MRTRSTLEPTQGTALGWSGTKDQQNKTGYMYLVLCNFIALRGGGHKIFVASLVDPFLVDCISFHQYSSTDPTIKFHDVHDI